ncbi:transcriptional regulator family: Fungal Specific TF [Penicillium roqueforti]|uniref:Zn(2)-C6 fungal-type DNA-binding domain n=1 Tax=Penicillium roqueforti (strain FM164) TaxID=1365484 RepID=W6Q412_PENRF|nr:transcriptional regulator family: Fungal Specific TF [Penicillium roqueforti]CDM31333.1 Zn(2)-C6 fungal-type DNA-binding domain [Penicillium roqueforti FM164]KAF9253573.1 transcriptional regulator family: Fungal Specific TF [Penicillium roqueforti]KAI1839090.1 transcriptional regulator family: Fungal Specific TF [Penicillium roqueforti]KAI2686394.1 transcriptional regulator family: Fungal Specific TF [Penicillium roqueforti]KAI2691557.1 transcriptional regulator family: Fungal Specific TF [
MPITPSQARTKKCQRACERCRSMKVKCSGVSPCTRCARKKKHCHFPVEEARVSVSERYLRELEEHISRSGSSGRHGLPATLEHSLGGTLFTGDDNVDVPPTPQASSTLLDNQADIGWRSMSIGMGPSLHTPGTPQRDHETDSEQDNQRSRFSRNPLVDRDPSFAQTPDGRFWYMGPTSSWSFCRRVLALIGRKVPESNCPPDPFHIDGVAFRLTWRPYPPDEVPDVTNLPPLDYALFLFNTVKFYFGFLSFMIDEHAYLQDLHEFYRDPPAKAASNRPWYCQYLLVLAFGKAFLTQKNSSGTPPGHQYASRAMALLPDLSGVDEDPLGCIQALSLGAVYLQSIDMRRAAFQHIGHALRGCIIEGIHRHVPEDICGPELSKRCRTIFWVVYMLDREFSALIGAPSSIRDEDITVKLPAEMDDSVEQINLTLHVRLSRLMATILTTVYGVGNDSDDTLVRSTQSILHSMAELSYDLTAFLNAHFHGLISRASKMAIRLMLAHHHCIVLTTRPLVMCALHMHIERTERQKSQTIVLAPPVASLLQCCADSAQTILQTLRTLADDDLMDAFLPFQIEDASSSAFVLYLIRAIAPSVISNDTWCDNLALVLDKLIAKGNLAAPLRRLELKQLEQILAPLTPKLANHSLPQANLDEYNEINEEPYSFDHEEFEWDLLGLNSSVSLPPRELLDLADQLDVEGIMQSVGV